MIIVRINKDGKEIAMCEIWKNEYDTMFTVRKNGIKSIYGDKEQGEQGFTDMIEIDLE